MTVATKPETVLEGIWRVTGLAGFNHAHDGRALDIRRELGKRLCSFIISSGISLEFGEECTLGWIKSITEKKLKPIDRTERLTIELINELTLKWAATFVRYQYRGISRGDTLNLLKREVVWLLKEFGYSLPERHTLFCPHLNVWDEVVLHRIKWNDDKSTPFEFVPRDKVSLPEECEECVSLYKVARR